MPVPAPEADQLGHGVPEGREHPLHVLPTAAAGPGRPRPPQQFGEFGLQPGQFAPRHGMGPLQVLHSRVVVHGYTSAFLGLRRELLSVTGGAA